MNQAVSERSNRPNKILQLELGPNTNELDWQRLPYADAPAKYQARINCTQQEKKTDCAFYTLSVKLHLRHKRTDKRTKRHVCLFVVSFLLV